VLSLTLVAVLSVVATIFVLSNQQTSQVSFAGYEAEMPAWLLILASMAAGAVLVLLVGATRRVTGRIRNR
jgi:uncharacterized integral membrane protein